jgi:hypothetical protein
MDNDNKDPAPAQPRRAYVAPRVEESAAFEHLVLSCLRTGVLDFCASPEDDSTAHS